MHRLTTRARGELPLLAGQLWVWGRRLLLPSIGCGCLPCIASRSAPHRHHRCSMHCQSVYGVVGPSKPDGLQATTGHMRPSAIESSHAFLLGMCSIRAAVYQPEGSTLGPDRLDSQGPGHYAGLTESSIPQSVGGFCSSLCPGVTSSIKGV